MLGINNITVVFSFIFLMAPFTSQAANIAQGWGRVNMQGAIIDTACAIAVESRDQTIDLGIVPVADIIRDGHGRSKPFTIELVNCELEREGNKLPDWKNFQVTFDGDSEGALFGVQGDASGVALQINESSGHAAIPGSPLPLRNITPGAMQLNYTMKLVANNHALKAGNYFSSIRFKLDYF
jgi:type 1 fimbria pilin